MTVTITTFGWVPPFARGFVRDIRPRWACEEVGQPYTVEYIADAKAAAHRARQPFGQVPSYRDDEVAIFESGAIVLRIAERAGRLLPPDPTGRATATQWLIAALNTVEPVVMALNVNDVFEAEQPWSAQRHGTVVADLRERLDALERVLTDRRWLDGDVFTAGDLMMISVLGGLRNTDLLGGYPCLAAYVERGESRPAHCKAMADHLAAFGSPVTEGDCG